MKLGKITIKDAEGNEFEYEGELLEGKANGKGNVTLASDNEMTYTGTFYENMMHGLCKHLKKQFAFFDRLFVGISRDAGDIEISEWRKDNQHGKATAYTTYVILQSPNSTYL